MWWSSGPVSVPAHGSGQGQGCRARRGTGRTPPVPVPWTRTGALPTVTFSVLRGPRRGGTPLPTVRPEEGRGTRGSQRDGESKVRGRGGDVPVTGLRATGGSSEGCAHTAREGPGPRGYHVTTRPLGPSCPLCPGCLAVGVEGVRGGPGSSEDRSLGPHFPRGRKSTNRPRLVTVFASGRETGRPV